MLYDEPRYLMGKKLHSVYTSSRNYGVIYADPPWDYRGQVQHGGRGAGYTSGAKAYYPTMPLEQLCDGEWKRELRDVTERNSVLFMWATGPILVDALEVMKAWGYKYKQVAFVWDKVMVNPGAYTMTQCEFCLVGTRGSIPKPRGARNVRQHVAERRTRHSAKPSTVRHRIEEMFPEHAGLELFSRVGPGVYWDVWGNDVPIYCAVNTPQNLLENAGDPV